MSKNAAQRAAKRSARESRPDKGVSTAAKRQAKNHRIRQAREQFNFPDDSMSLLTMALLGRKR